SWSKHRPKSVGTHEILPDFPLPTSVGQDDLLAGPSFSSRCSRIFLITAKSSMQAMTLIAPPRALRGSMSMLNTRLSVVPRSWRSAARQACGFTRSGSLVLFVPLRWGEQGAVVTIGRKHPVEAGEADA